LPCAPTHVQELHFVTRVSVLQNKKQSASDSGLQRSAIYRRLSDILSRCLRLFPHHILPQTTTYSSIIFARFITCCVAFSRFLIPLCRPKWLCPSYKNKGGKKTKLSPHRQKAENDRETTEASKRISVEILEVRRLKLCCNMVILK
jgi:hypothetical protein